MNQQHRIPTLEDDLMEEYVIAEECFNRQTTNVLKIEPRSVEPRVSA